MLQANTGRQVVPDFIQRVGVDGTNSRQIECFQQHLLQRPDRPRQIDRGRHREQNRLRRGGVGLIVLKRESGRLFRARHDFDPFVDQQPSQRLAHVNRRGGLHGEGKFSAWQALPSLER